MIPTVEITNYQGHANTLMEFHRGLNVIRGSSDRGKSSIIRAFKWNILNRPAGFGFKSFFAGPKNATEVGIEYDNGFVLRQKTKTTNQYTVSGIDKPLQAIRSDVPDEVKDIAHMSETNIQGQYDRYFLLQETPGQRAKMINKVAGLDIIDKATSNIKGIVKKAKNDLQYARTQTSRLEDDLTEYDFIDSIEKRLGEAEILETRIIKLKSDKQALEVLVASITNIQQKINEFDSLPSIEQNHIKAVKLISKIEVTLTKKEALVNITNNIYQVTGELNGLQIVPDLYKRILKANKLLESYNNVYNESNSLRDIVSHIIDTSDTLDKVFEHTKRREQVYHKAIIEAKICPTCKQPLPLNILKELLGENT